jgi:hypothetical protein
MYRSRPFGDRARRWRQFCRTGWQLAWGVSVLWFGALALLFRVAPAPVPTPHEAPAPMAWWPASGDPTALDVRALWTPSAFALSSPAGFSHSQRSERSRLTPPVQVVRPDSALMENPRLEEAFDLLTSERIQLVSAPLAPGWESMPGVFPPRTPATDSPKLLFPDGWESRLFSGIDLNYGDWSDTPWTAQVEIHFDPKGIPTSVLLARSSGLVEVDRRLARSISGWRLLDPDALRSGLVVWSAPRRPPQAASELSAETHGEGGSL